MKIGICLIIKDENDYLDEWLSYYRKLGVDRFFIYDNNSQTPIKSDDDDVDIILWDNEEFGAQNKAYTHCCLNNQNFDYIGFFDTDEFYVSNTMNIKEDILNLIKNFGKFNGLGVYWRLYGKPKPYYTDRKSISEYKHYHNSNHIKSFIDPKTIKGFSNPHCPIIDGRFIDELGRVVNSPIGPHTSETIWIKHIWSRSLPEFKEKIKRGDPNKVIRDKKIDEFYTYNDNCIIHD